MFFHEQRSQHRASLATDAQTVAESSNDVIAPPTVQSELDELLSHLSPDEAADLLHTMSESVDDGSFMFTCHDNESRSGDGWCPMNWDSLLCWPTTPGNTSAVLPCFAEFRKVKYDTSENASRWCHANGSWSGYSNYSACQPERSTGLDSESSHLHDGIELTSYIYFAGYALSLLALVVATAIFIYFKDLRCLRNTIHTNLMFTYIMTDFMWMLSLILQMSVHTDMTWCVFLIILLHYFHLTNFFWMFVEGLYLYMLVVETFYAENMKLKVYASIGWGGPGIFVISWAVAKSFSLSSSNDTLSIGAVDWKHCPWMSPHILDWLYQAPVLIVLAVNLLFLLIIMWVLITKLRSANTVETQQYRKATKALLVLIPLLGTTYILVIMGPTEGISRDIYDAVSAILLSTQGFTVALFYCFLNTEVQNTLRHHLERWKESRALGGSRRYRYHSKDWSPRSRTESIRLCTHPTHKRESTASETTTTTLVGMSTAPNGGAIRCCVGNGPGGARGGPLLQPPGD